MHLARNPARRRSSHVDCASYVNSNCPASVYDCCLTVRDEEERYEFVLSLVEVFFPLEIVVLSRKDRETIQVSLACTPTIVKIYISENEGLFN